MGKKKFDERVKSYVLYKHLIEGVPIRQIANDLQKKGIKISKSYVHKIIQTHSRKNEPDLFTLIEKLKKYVKEESELQEIIDDLQIITRNLYKERAHIILDYLGNDLSEEKNTYFIRFENQQESEAFLKPIYDAGIDKSEKIETIAMDEARQGIWVRTVKEKK